MLLPFTEIGKKSRLRWYVGGGEFYFGQCGMRVTQPNGNITQSIAFRDLRSRKKLRLEKHIRESKIDRWFLINETGRGSVGSIWRQKEEMAKNEP